jgi:hypothetical protein
MNAVTRILTMLLLAPTFLALHLQAQVTYNLVGRDVVQSRLALYKGNDRAREASLVKLFTDAGCAAKNLTEQPVPGRKQPNVICTFGYHAGNNRRRCPLRPRLGRRRHCR